MIFGQQRKECIEFVAFTLTMMSVRLAYNLAPFCFLENFLV